jgi:DNA-directed RNA polymerase specialized sigma24 family protein
MTQLSDSRPALTLPDYRRIAKKARPLTPEQRELVEGCAGWVRPWVHCVVLNVLIRQFGIEEVMAEAWDIIVRAASIWKPDRGATFKSFAMNGVKRFLPEKLMRLNRNRNVWVAMPEVPDGAELVDLVPDHRSSGEIDRLLSLWCSEEAMQLRNRLGPRVRLFMYLKLVEGWTYREIGDVFGISKQRIQQMMDRAQSDLARRNLGGD